jgi:hypothetical protein
VDHFRVHVVSEEGSRLQHRLLCCREPVAKAAMDLLAVELCLLNAIEVGEPDMVVRQKSRVPAPVVRSPILGSRSHDGANDVTGVWNWRSPACHLL